jgi:glycerol kinase
MKEQLILALDQGTTSSRAILYDRSGNIVDSVQRDFPQHFPKPGRVEHDPKDIWSSQISVAAEVLAKRGLGGADIAAIGITNQRETTVVWDRETGEPVYNAIVWQDRRTAGFCDELKAAGHADTIRAKTGLVLDAYFSGTKVKWILDHVPGARDRAERGELCFGTVDSWLVWKLTRGKLHITDTSNASRTLLFNIHTLQWDDELLALFDVPRAMLPEVRDSSELYGHTDAERFGAAIPIAGIAGDQQAALFGQLCTSPGMVKNTYGTGCFLLMNTGDKPVASKHQLLTTVGWTIGGHTTYALEGSVFVGGAAVQWLRDGLKLIDASSNINALAASVPDSAGVVFVPALTGLGAPYWDPHARGAILGITRGTTDAHLARATLEGIAFQVHDIVRAMEADAATPCTELRVDGGASASDLLLQIQSDLLRSRIVRPASIETTALGAAYLAGLAVGYWDSIDALQQQWTADRSFEPQADAATTEHQLQRWHRAVDGVRKWDRG